MDVVKMRKLLQRRFNAPSWALLFEVKSATGYANGEPRSADAVAISLWPSRGLALHGIEIKVHRSDWLRELKKPNKSEPVQKYCNFWWIAAPKGVVEVDELPVTWGLLEESGKRGLVAKRQAPELSPVSLDLSFVASLGRRMGGSVDQAMRTARQELMSEQADSEINNEEYERGVADAVPQLERVRRELKQLYVRVAEFEKASGISVDSYDSGLMGTAARLLSRQRLMREVNLLDPALRELESTLADMRTIRKTLRGHLYPERAKDPQ